MSGISRQIAQRKTKEHCLKAHTKNIILTLLPNRSCSELGMCGFYDLACWWISCPGRISCKTEWCFWAL